VRGDARAGPEATGPSGGRSGGRSWAQRDRIVPKTRQLSFNSRLLFRIDHYTSLPGAALVVGVLLMGAVVVGVVLGFRSGWLTAFESGTSVVTLMMLFVIQHTQGREQAATQRKLDELLRALPEAESGLMMLEEASDDEMRDVEQDQRESREQAVEDAGLTGETTTPVDEPV
jgi:low affinity Fe/Cu permease